MVTARKEWISLILFLLILLMRKAGFLGSSLFLYAIVLFTSFHLIVHQTKESLINIFISSFLIISVLFLQSFIATGIPGVIFLLSWIIFISLSFVKIKRSGFRIALSLIISFVLLAASIFNARTFHNFFRSTYYEEYIRSKYTEQEGIIADLYIDKYKKIEKEKSDAVLEKAFEADGLNTIDLALKLYNEGIDLNPDNANAYHRRGFFKLTKLDLDIDMAYSAIKDFDRAIRLNPGFTLAYFHRYLATDYLNLKGRALLDRKRVWETDSSLTETDFLKKYGISKTTFSKPFHP